MATVSSPQIRTVPGPRWVGPAAISRVRAWSPYLLLSAIFAWAIADQLLAFPYAANALGTYVWLPSGSERIFFWTLTAAETGVVVLALLPRFRRIALVLGASTLLVLALLPLGNFWSLGVAACGAKFSLLIRPPGWKNLAFLLSTSAFLFSVSTDREG